MLYQGPLKPSDTCYMGFLYNIKLEWEDGSTTIKPMSVRTANHLVTCTLYARDNVLSVSTPKLKKLWHISNHEKIFTWVVRPLVT